MPVLYLMLGLPGAGKTTAANIIHELTGAEHVSSDMMRLEIFDQPRFSPQEHNTLYAELNSRVEQLLVSGEDVIYDANLNRLKHRQEKYDICSRTGSQPILIWVQTAKELAKTRATRPSRNHLVPPDEKPDEMFERIAGVIEEPGPAEPYIALDGTNVTEQAIAEKLNLAHT